MYTFNLTKKACFAYAEVGVQKMASFFSALALTAALSIDTFVACLAYGASKIKIPVLQTIIINFICTCVLGISILIGGLLSNVIDPEITKYISFSILILVGCVKFFGELFKSWLKKSKDMGRNFNFKLFHIHFLLKIICDCTEADKDKNKLISVAESITLSLALSIDSIGVGLSAGMSEVNHYLIIGLNFLIGIFAVVIGDLIGRKLAKRIHINLSWLSGLILIVLAIFKLF